VNDISFSNEQILVETTVNGSLDLQYLRARYLKVETGTFTSRDTYVENNPVTFADSSGIGGITSTLNGGSTLVNNPGE